ncbi:uncharacterized protein PGRI_030860 [Penicillium griseofulvum]|uniref:Uncharacterized protein n=1 Tax=Penicillium patulum TaxID=5078 RepID=A0A135LJQ8_PENPA|nr:uncharacterized protein PGRI_030860 [Penicillium griseofulvum]KXG49216.1 hypothetical protein PGRI_030860 [Penicillium griseofulvum]
MRQQSQARGRLSNPQSSNHPAAQYRGPIRPGMGSSRYAPVAYVDQDTFELDPMELDPMEIDDPVQEPPPPTAPASMTQGPGVDTIHRHVYYIPIRSHPMPVLDLDVITAARTELARLEGTGMPILEALPEQAGPHVFIRIDTNHIDRRHALMDANLRMGAMQDMIQDGFGWFTGLPYRHPHFEVKFLRGRRL